MLQLCLTSCYDINMHSCMNEWMNEWNHCMYELPMCMHPCSALTLPASSVEHSAPVWHSKFFSEVALSVLLVLLGHLIQPEGAVSSLCVHCALKVRIRPCGLCIVQTCTFTSMHRHCMGQWCAAYTKAVNVTTFDWMKVMWHEQITFSAATR